MVVRIQAVLVPTDWYGKVCTYAVKMSLGCILYSVVVSRKVENVAYDVRVQIEIRYVSDALMQIAKWKHHEKGNPLSKKQSKAKL